MKLPVVKIVWSEDQTFAQFLNKLLCRVGIHSYETKQDCFRMTTKDGDSGEFEAVVAWKCCKRCYRSKLVHIL